MCFTRFKLRRRWFPFLGNKGTAAAALLKLRANPTNVMHLTKFVYGVLAGSGDQPHKTPVNCCMNMHNLSFK